MRTWTSHAERHKKIHAIQKNRQRRTAAAHRAINNQNQAFNGRFIFGRFRIFFLYFFANFLIFFLHTQSTVNEYIHGMDFGRMNGIFCIENPLNCLLLFLMERKKLWSEHEIGLQIFVLFFSSNQLYPPDWFFSLDKRWKIKLAIIWNLLSFRSISQYLKSISTPK